MPERPLAQLRDPIYADQLTGADDPDPVGRMLHLVERVEERKTVLPSAGGLAHESPKLLLQQRVEPARRLVQDQQRRRCMNACTSPSF